MRRTSFDSPHRTRKRLLAFGALMVVVLLGVGWELIRNQAPAIVIVGQVKGIGLSTPVTFEVRDGRHVIKQVAVEVWQNQRAFPIPVTGQPLSQARAWWRLWAPRTESRITFSVRIGRREIPELAEGRAMLRITATNDSWSRFFRGGRAELSLDVPVRFTPPQVQVLSFPHYVNQGGAELVVFRVSPATVESGVQVGDHFFPSWPVKESLPETRLCLFAFPHNLHPEAPVRIVARDELGNETLTNFTYRLFPKRFRQDTITLTDEFMARIVPAIISQTPELQDQGELLKNFLLINGRLRELNAQQLVALAQKTAPRFLWRQPFIQLGGSQVEAGFADARTYLYQGRVVDQQTHLGFDLAVTEHTPVVAANDGEVVYTGFLGIYGNTIVIDHGCGLQTIYSHLSSIDVASGQRVVRGQPIGRTGQTGLAGGDHLHFCTLLQGIPINPVEWWDAHWLQDRIFAKLAPYS